MKDFFVYFVRKYSREFLLWMDVKLRKKLLKNHYCEYNPMVCFFTSIHSPVFVNMVQKILLNIMYTISVFESFTFFLCFWLICSTMSVPLSVYYNANASASASASATVATFDLTLPLSLPLQLPLPLLSLPV